MQSLRSYLESLQRSLSDQLVRVEKPASYNYEVTAQVVEMEKREDNPALLFENVKGCSSPLLINLFGNVDRFLIALNGTSRSGSRLDFYRRWNELITKEISPIYVEKGPVKEVIYKGDDVDLFSLPIPKFYEQDGGRYVTAGLLVARNPENPEELNLTYARMQLKGRNRFGFSLHSMGHAWQYFERSKAAGRPLDAAVIIGAHPSLYLAAAAKIVNEYRTAGALSGEPMELVRCETVDIPVPAQAEIVLEGQIGLENEDEGPFTEYTGYISGRSTRNLFRVSALTMRRDAIFLAVAPSNSSEHLLLSGLPKQARIFQAMNVYAHASALKDIVWPVWGTHFVCFFSLRESVGFAPGLAKQLGLLLLGLDHYVKIVAVFPAEMDISDVASAFGAMASRCDFKYGSGIEVISGVFSHLLDPSSPMAGVSSKMIIDASKTLEDAPSQNTKSHTRGVLPADKIIDYAFPGGGNRRFCAIHPNPNIRDLRELLNEKELQESRLIVCVDDDIDIRDCRQILWAIATRFQPADGTILENNRMIMDARKGVGWTAKRATLPQSLVIQ